MYDFYSCFPIVPLEASRILGLCTGDVPRTLTGGLPFFGGPGNNYSLHAIAEAHERVRGQSTVAVVYANGGMTTKHAAGRYSGIPPKAVRIKTSPPTPRGAETSNDENPEGRIATYTVEYKRGEATGVLCIGETDDGARFYARGGADQAADILTDDPLGAHIKTRTISGQNMISVLTP